MSYQIPDPRWEMPELLVPGTFPTGNVVVDWSNPLTRGLKTVYLAGKNKNIANNSPVLRHGTYALNQVSGKRTLFDGSSMAKMFMDCETSDYKWTIMAKVEGDWNNLGGIITGFQRLPTGFDAVSLRKFYDGVSYSFEDIGGTTQTMVVNAGNGGKLEWGKPKTLAGVTRSATDHEIYIDGDSKVTSSTDISGYNYDKMSAVSLGANMYSTGTAYNIMTADTVELEYSFAWVRALSVEEIRSITLDPYQFLIPE